MENKQVIFLITVNKLILIKINIFQCYKLYVIDLQNIKYFKIVKKIKKIIHF